jgi:hypothetical protein
MTRALAVILMPAILMLASRSPVSGSVRLDGGGFTVLLALLTTGLFTLGLLQRARHLPEPIEPAIYWWAACLSIIGYTSIAAVSWGLKG